MYNRRHGLKGMIRDEREDSKTRDDLAHRPVHGTVAERPGAFRKHLRRTLIAAALFISALTAYVVSRFVPRLPDPLNDFFLALTAAMAVHLLDRLWLLRDTEESLDDVKRNVVENVAHETGRLIGQLDKHTSEALSGILTSIQKTISSLEAMTRAGILRVFANREEAAEEMVEDLTHPSNQRLRIVGISLNDFILRTDPKLGAAWRHLQAYVEKGIEQNRNLDIRILLIDPICFGAELRSKGEERASKSAGRLQHDIERAVDELIRLENACEQRNVKFACKLYRLPPILFLCMTDSVAYVQQYYFWSSRLDHKSFPILKFQNIQSSDDLRSIYSELEMHFDWIWEKASIGLREFRDACSLGADRGIAQAGVTNVYTDPSDGLARMHYLLVNAKQKVSIQGISLHSFFNRSSPKLYLAISALLMNDNVNVEVLFLNPECEQAKFRGYREHLFDDPSFPREDYFASTNNAHELSTLYRETQAAKSALELMVREIASKKPAGWTPKLVAGCYDSAPYCFLLRVDDTVLVEQYHYGKLPDDVHGVRTVLGKELPLVEYVKSPVTLFETTLRTPFALLENHFDFALKEAGLLPVQQWANTLGTNAKGPAAKTAVAGAGVMVSLAKVSPDSDGGAAATQTSVS